MLLLDRHRRTFAKKSNGHSHEAPPFPLHFASKGSSDVLRRDFRHLLWTDAGGTPLKAPVEVIVTTRLERSGGEYVVGDLVYTLSLLPGEEVQMFTTDRRTRFSLDTETKIGYHTATTFEDQMYMSAMDTFFGQLSASQWAQADASTSGSLQAHGDTSSVLDGLLSGPSADMTGSFNTNSFADFVGGMSAQASTAHQVTASATNTASAVSVGAVGIRTNIEGKLDTHVEMNYRSFRNPSRTRAVTFYFFQIRRMHRVRFWVDSITVSAPERTMWRMANVPQNGVTPHLAAGAQPTNLADYANFRDARELVAAELVGKQLLAASNGGYAMPEVVREQTTFDQVFSLATPGLYVRGGRDVSDVADPSLFRELTLFGGIIADEAESLAVSFVERLGSGIVPAVVNTVVAAQALISGANAAAP
jgi:hypothetical protein